MTKPVAAVAPPEASVAWPKPRSLSLPRLGVGLRPLAGRLALAALFAGVAAVVVFAANEPTQLAWYSKTSFPGWLAGPLGGLLGRVPHPAWDVSFGFSWLSLAMLAPYGIALLAARALSLRTIWLFIGAVSVLLVLSPPIQLTDLFNYLGYARLWALHGLNPYTHVIQNAPYDPVTLFATWRNWHSPYGTVFTILTYPLGLMPLSAAYWVLKAATVALAVAFVWLVQRCAVLLERDPRPAVLLLAANPLFLLYAVPEFHNDFFMLVPAMGAIALVLSGRDRAAGAAIATAIFVKFTAILILPFLVLAAPMLRRKARIGTGVLLAGVPLLVVSVLLFGLALPNIAAQAKLLTPFSIANLLGWVLGLGGGAPTLITLLELLVLVVAAQQLLRGRDWISGAGWTTVALIASLGWLMPWYVIWLLPLAALGASVRLRRAALVLTVFLVVTFMPYFAMFLNARGVRPLMSPVGQAARAAAFRYEH